MKRFYTSVGVSFGDPRAQPHMCPMELALASHRLTVTIGAYASASVGPHSLPYSQQRLEVHPAEGT